MSFLFLKFVNTHLRTCVKDLLFKVQDLLKISINDLQFTNPTCERVYLPRVTLTYRVHPFLHDYPCLKHVAEPRAHFARQELGFRV